MKKSGFRGSILRIRPALAETPIHRRQPLAAQTAPRRLFRPVDFEMPDFPGIGEGEAFAIAL